MVIIDFQNNYIFGIQPYTFWAGAGIAFSSILFLFLLYKNNIKIERQILILVFGLIGLVFGAILCGCIKNLINVLYYHESITFEIISKSGLVYYGGLAGFLLFSCFTIWKLYNKIDLILMNIIMIVIPLFHCFGRIGCLFAGCCFGIEYDGGFCICYVYDSQQVISRFPTQLIESAFELFVFLLLLYIYRKNNNYNLIKLYLFLYACGRFLLEFTRGDTVRGVWHRLSFSQYISIGIIIFIILLYVISLIRKNIKSNMQKDKFKIV